MSQHKPASSMTALHQDTPAPETQDELATMPEKGPRVLLKRNSIHIEGSNQQISKEKKSAQDPDKEVTHVCEMVSDVNSMEEKETLKENQT